MVQMMIKIDQGHMAVTPISQDGRVLGHVLASIPAVHGEPARNFYLVSWSKPAGEQSVIETDHRGRIVAESIGLTPAEGKEIEADPSLLMECDLCPVGMTDTYTIAYADAGLLYACIPDGGDLEVALGMEEERSRISIDLDALTVVEGVTLTDNPGDDEEVFMGNLTDACGYHWRYAVLCRIGGLTHV